MGSQWKDQGNEGNQEMEEETHVVCQIQSQWKQEPEGMDQVNEGKESIEET